MLAMTGVIQRHLTEENDNIRGKNYKSNLNGTAGFENSYWNTQITFYLETSGGQNSNLYLNVHFSHVSVN